MELLYDLCLTNQYLSLIFLFALSSALNHSICFQAGKIFKNRASGGHMGFDGAPRNNRRCDKVDSDGDRGNRTHPRRSLEDKRESKDRQEHGDLYDDTNCYGGDFDRVHNARSCQDGHKQRVNGLDELGSHTNHAVFPKDGSEEGIDYSESFRSHIREDVSPFNCRDGKDHHSLDRIPRDGETHKNSHSRSNNHSETRLDGNKYQKMHDSGCIPRGEDARRYNKSDDLHKRTKVDNKSHLHDSLSQKSAKPKHVPADPNSTLGIFGLNQFVTEEEMKTALAEKLHGMGGCSLKMIVDERTGLSKGFCFVDFVCLDDAMSAKDILNNESFRGQDFRCDYSYKHRVANG